MDIHRSYQCDFGHSWIIRRDESDPERNEDTFCPEGHEAVTCQKQLPADEVQILLKPAARMVDPLRNQVVERDRYWLILLDRRGDQLLRSAEAYPWEKVVALAQLFRGKTSDQARQWWERKKP